MLVGDVGAGNYLPTCTIPVFDESLAVAAADGPHVVGGKGADGLKFVVCGGKCGRGHYGPILTVPMLNELLRPGGQVAKSSDGPYVIRRHRGYAIEVVVR